MPRFTGLSDRFVVSVGGAVPVVGASPIHAVSMVADQFSVPPPVLDTRMEDVCGAVLPTNACSVRALGVTDRNGGGVMTNVTVICAGLPVAPADVTVTWPVWVPVASPAGLSVTVIEAAPVPLLGAALSHVVSVDVLQDRTPPPGFVTLSVRILEPLPCWALSRTDVGVTDSTGCRMLNVTRTLALSFASVELITTVSVSVPAGWPLGFRVSPSLEGAVPEAAERVSHETVGRRAAVQANVPPSPLLIWMVSVRDPEPTFAESA